MTDSILRSYQYYSTTTVVPYPAAEAVISSPLDLPDLVLWYDANVGVYQEDAASTPSADGDAVKAWVDQASGIIVDTNASGPGQIYETTSLVNSLPAVRTRLFGQLIYDTAAFITGSGDAFSFWIVATAGSASDDGGRLFSLRGEGAGADSNNTLSILMAGVTTTGPKLYTYFNSGEVFLEQPISYDTPYRYSVIADGTNLTTYLNNANALTDTYAAMALDGRRMGIGNNVSGGEVLRGDISEIIMTTSAVNSSVRAQIDAYLEAKWGF